MRIVIYDGILETHVASSLERSLVRFGHDVLNTGKFGSGFAFPEPGKDISHIEATVQRVIAFDPDVLFVMRPASLPLELLSRVKSHGIRLIAWFSDDPVLFDLSYGPVLQSYDLVLHCGNERVLRFYEDFFGFPTGVNFPFWTDHESFPYVWGSQNPSADIMFLGNVQDKVRRRRYFDLGKLDLDVRVHGSIGADYFGLDGGYLYTDREVAESGATVRLALNIPQYFKDHRGLPTWFPGLDNLGFFEYPSRVIQYMAMGIPTISVVPEARASDFTSYPEMFVAKSIEEAGEIAKQLISDGKLSALSNSVLERFDRNFSADSRVQMLEHILDSDSWRRLDAHDRANWFTEFNGKDLSSYQLDRSPQLQAGRSFGLDLADGSSNSLHSGSSKPVRVLILSGDVGSPYSRGNAAYEWMITDERFEVSLKSIEDFKKCFSQDPQKICEFALLVNKIQPELVENKIDVLLITDADVSLTQSGAAHLRELGVKSAIVNDEQTTNGWLKLQRMIQTFDGVFTSRYSDVEKALYLGYYNCSFIPAFVKPAFMGALSECRSKRKVVRVGGGTDNEENSYPAISRDARFLTMDKLTFDRLEELSTDELASTLKSVVSLMTFPGTRECPVIHRMAPYVAIASEVSVVGRSPQWQRVHPYDRVCVTVQAPGELATKLDRLNAIQGDESKTDNRLAPLVSAPSNFLASILNLGRSACLKTAPFNLALKNHKTIQIPVKKVGGKVDGLSSLVRVVTDSAVCGLKSWWLRIRVDGRSTFGIAPTGCDEFFVNGVSDPDRLTVEAVYVGKSCSVCDQIAFSGSVSIETVSELSTRGSAVSVSIVD